MDSALVPAHLGIIPDGNRRWARAHGMPSLMGHRQGVQTAKGISVAAIDRGVKFFTMFGFSAENWQRATKEVAYLMDLWYGLLVHEFHELEARGVQFRFIGSRDRLSDKMLRAIDDTESRTAKNTAGVVSLCLNYGGQAEMADTFRAMMAEGIKPDEVTPELVSRYVYAPDIPPVDLVIRTSGEQRTSGFMMWRAAYAELYFVDKHWPDFTVADLDEALAEFASRQRRYGK